MKADSLDKKPRVDRFQFDSIVPVNRLTLAVFFVFLLVVLLLGDFFVPRPLAGEALMARGLNPLLRNRLGTDGKPGKQLLDILALARRACGNGRVFEHQQFKFAGALVATVIVDGHVSSGVNTTLCRVS